MPCSRRGGASGHERRRRSCRASPGPQGPCSVLSKRSHMKTEDLVEALVADRAIGGKSIPRVVAGALGIGSLVSLGLFFACLGVRGDIVQALATWRFDLKGGIVLLALVLALSLSLGLSRPVALRHPRPRLLPL